MFNFGARIDRKDRFGGSDTDDTDSLEFVLVEAGGRSNGDGCDVDGDTGRNVGNGLTRSNKAACDTKTLAQDKTTNNEEDDFHCDPSTHG